MLKGSFAVLVAMALTGCASTIDREPPEISQYVEQGGEEAIFEEGLRNYQLGREERAMEIIEPLARDGYPPALRLIAKQGDNEIDGNDTCPYQEPHWSVEALAQQGDPDAIMAYWNCISDFGRSDRFRPKDGLYYLGYLSEKGSLDATYALYEYHASYTRSNAAPIPSGWLTSSYSHNRDPNLEKAGYYADTFGRLLVSSDNIDHTGLQVARFIRMQLSVANSYVAFEEDSKAKDQYSALIAMADQVIGNVRISRQEQKKLKDATDFAEQQIALL